MRASFLTLCLAALLAVVPTLGPGIQRGPRHARGGLGSPRHARRGSEAAIAFPFESDERFNFFFTPRERKGLTLYAMTPAQRDAAAGCSSRR